ncbi:class I SAM-dependent methyltransferase [Bacteroidia bacterium]|nr:class I SAM-dependent methyltransferase [Bacteroidia bacterium]MDC1395263.1 class I SAM-dependent methyltransferase [Bacteroidia bacterium]
MNNKEHWEKIYTTKTPQEVSWTQNIPKTSLDLIEKYNLSKDANIIDVGGGDSVLVDHLLKLGYTKLSVLDISEAAIKRAQKRLGSDAEKVTWIVSDITKFSPNTSYDLWHDRAVFHFLTEQGDIDTYIDLVRDNVSKLVIGTFSEDGPLKCSGLEITQYDEAKIIKTFYPTFNSLECFTVDHTTPFDTTQNFIFARMTKSE